jgi:hypothetical protein
MHGLFLFYVCHYPGDKQISLKPLFSQDGKILDSQAVMADKRIDVISTVIHSNLTVKDWAELELAYTSSFGSAKDPINIASYVTINVLNQFHELIEWRELRRSFVTRTAGLQFIDVCAAEEYEFGSISTVRNIDINRLSEHLNELDRNAPVVLLYQIG